MAVSPFQRMKSQHLWKTVLALLAVAAVLVFLFGRHRVVHSTIATDTTKAVEK